MRGWATTAGVLMLAACGGRAIEPAATVPAEAGADGTAVIDAGSAGCAGSWENGYCTITLASVPPDVVSDVHWSGGVAVDSRNAYWISVLPPDCSPCNGSFDSVMSVPLRGGANTTLASGYYEPTIGGSRIAVDSASVYWTGTDLNSATAAVWKVPVGGGAATPLASSSTADVEDPVLHATSVYWIAGGTEGDSAVMRAALSGGAATTLANSSCIYGPLAVDAAHVYWFDCHDLLETPLGGGATVTLAGSVGIDLTVDSTSVYWTSTDEAGDSAVLKIPVDGGNPVTLASAAGKAAGSIAVDSTSVYWLESSMSPSVSSVMKIPIGGGAAVTIASVQETSPAGIALDASGTVYWTVGDALMKTTPLVLRDR